MVECAKIDITGIDIIIRKTEPNGFHFENPSRTWDGFVLFINGTGIFTDPDGRPHTIDAGSLILLDRSSRYQIHSDSACAYVTSGLFFSDQTRDTLSALPRILKCPETQYHSILQMAQVWQKREWDSYILCHIALLELYMNLLHIQHKNKAGEDPIVSRAVNFLHQHFKTGFSLNELAEYCRVSSSGLRYRFKKVMGVTVLEYRDRLRMKAACEMLRSGFFTIKEIAYELGYCDVYHFSKTFTAYVGVSPGKYQKSH